MLGVQLVEVKWISRPNSEANVKKKCSSTILEQSSKPSLRYVVHILSKMLLFRQAKMLCILC